MRGPVGIRYLSAIIALAISCAFMLGCAASAVDSADAKHSATVQALLPTSEPTGPPPTATTEARGARAYTPTPAAATSTPAAPTPTPAADTPARPTSTPVPQPTYTPRPTPPPAGEAERDEGILFQAQTLDGSVINLSDTRGTPTLLAFWAHW